jgi:hypothetical protein
MLLIFGIAGVAALTVTAYIRLRSRSPETAAATTRAVRELAAVILVCTRAIEGVVDALKTATPRTTYRPSRYSSGPRERIWDADFDDYQLEPEL